MGRTKTALAQAYSNSSPITNEQLEFVFFIVKFVKWRLLKTITHTFVMKKNNKKLDLALSKLRNIPKTKKSKVPTRQHARYIVKGAFTNCS